MSAEAEKQSSSPADSSLQTIHDDRDQPPGDAEDPTLITWDGPDDPANPKNWSRRRKWAATMVVSGFNFISPLASAMIAPCLPALAAELDITSSVEQSMALSVFVLGYAVGPLVVGPLSELYGRVPVLQTSNLVFLLFNLACGLARTKGEMIAFRFIAGLGGSAPQATGGGVLGDLWATEERGRALAFYSLAPLLGPAVGPIAGGFVAENTSWRWIFYATTISNGVVMLLGFLLLQETRASVLLERKKRRRIRETGSKAWHTETDNPDHTLRNIILTALNRPFRLLFTQPIVQVLAVYLAYIYGIVYLVLASFPDLWTSPDHYGESVGIGGLNYIALACGFLLGAYLCAPTQDRIYRRLKDRNGGVGRPEYRIPLMIPSAILVPVGLFIYGWTAEYRTFWIGPDIGIALYAAGYITSFQCVQVYIVDTYTNYAASALASVTVLRSLCAFTFPLFAPKMYDALGYGWGNSMLAFIAMGLGWPGPFVLWRYGQALRERSPYAAEI
uniref:Major facilitator superfamily transporter n=1 Tax=Paecilomyces divaricatus TaxID=644132 RepID=A0A3G1IHI1_PAEDI|nr:major facilitator superfamily transporter [Paecilomyces divaricatus]